MTQVIRTWIACSSFQYFFPKTVDGWQITIHQIEKPNRMIVVQPNRMIVVRPNRMEQHDHGLVLGQPD